MVDYNSIAIKTFAGMAGGIFGIALIVLVVILELRKEPPACEENEPSSTPKKGGTLMPYPFTWIVPHYVIKAIRIAMYREWFAKNPIVSRLQLTYYGMDLVATFVIIGSLKATTLGNFDKDGFILNALVDYVISTALLIAFLELQLKHLDSGYKSAKDIQNAVLVRKNMVTIILLIPYFGIPRLS